jgi:dodecin
VVTFDPSRGDPVRVESTGRHKEAVMGEVARVTEISARSTESFEDAIKVGIERARQTLRGVRSAWVKEQQVTVDDEGRIAEYQVNLMVTFVLE